MTQIPEGWTRPIAAWLGWLTLRGLSPDTIRLRAEHLRYVAAHSHTSSPSALTSTGLLAVFAGRTWSPAYRKSLRDSLRSFYAWATSAGVTDTDISNALPPVRPLTPHARPATDAIWAQLLGSATPREQLMARLAGEAGLRRAEVAALHTDDLAADADGPILIIRGKGDKQRVVPVSDALAALVAARPPGWVFPSRKGDGHLSAPAVGRAVSALMPPGWSMHKLRHRYATRGYAGTGNLRAVQEALGHASVATTQRYTAVCARDLRLVSEAASRDVSAAVSPNAGIAS